MKKREIIYRHILTAAMEDKKREFTQKEIAQELGVSVGTVFHALRVPRASHCVRVTGRNFVLLDPKKLLLIWATIRRLDKDMIYTTHDSKTIAEIEAIVPPGSIFSGYTAYKKRFRNPPADYDKLYVYIPPSDLPQMKKRFPPKKGYPNVHVLQADPELVRLGQVVPLPQLFVDLWNFPEWYARDFVTALEDKIDALLA